MKESKSEILGFTLLPELCLSILRERFYEWRTKMNAVIPQEVTPPNIPADVLDCLSKGGPAWNQQDYSTARQYANKALTLSQHHKSVHGEIGALQLLGNIAFNESDDKLSRELHQLIMEKSLTLDFSDGVAVSLTNLALIDIVEGNSASAQARYRRALELFEAAGNVGMADSIRTILGYERLEMVLDGIPRKG